MESLTDDGVLITFISNCVMNNQSPINGCPQTWQILILWSLAQTSDQKEVLQE